MDRIPLGEILNSMDSFTEKILYLLTNIDGACDGAFCGYDGIIIARHTLISVPMDMELICANFVSVIKTLKNTDNNPKDIITTFDKHTIFIKILEDGFVCLVLNVDGNLGRARLECARLPKNLVG